MKILVLFTLVLSPFYPVFAQDAVKVEPTSCICAKIFMPVCAGNRTFGNSCEAECAGFKKFQEGDCSEVKSKPKLKPKITPTYKKNTGK